jgi:hypothetical protein
MQGTHKYTYPNTTRVLGAVGIFAFAFVWVWLLDVVQAQGMFREMALYFPLAVGLVWFAAKFWRRRASN